MLMVTVATSKVFKKNLIANGNMADPDGCAVLLGNILFIIQILQVQTFSISNNISKFTLNSPHSWLGPE